MAAKDYLVIETGSQDRIEARKTRVPEVLFLFFDLGSLSRVTQFFVLSGAVFFFYVVRLLFASY